jgi:hypothetical protein
MDELSVGAQKLSILLSILYFFLFRLAFIEEAIQCNAIEPITEKANFATECSYALKIRLLKEHQNFLQS